ncbi:MAG: ferrous iron transport protein A [Chloroflexaceae bacterium]|nr:ferrous iron transport protein A [Chloroflexaceae bacterium]
MPTPSLPLPLAGEGATVRLVAIQGGQRAAHRLAELGLTPGVTVTVLRDSGGALLVAVGDTRLALSYGLAQMVLVTGEEFRDA